MKVGIKQISVITKPEDSLQFERLLEDGSELDYKFFNAV